MIVILRGLQSPISISQIHITKPINFGNLVKGYFRNFCNNKEVAIAYRLIIRKSAQNEFICLKFKLITLTSPN